MENQNEKLMQLFENHKKKLEKKNLNKTKSKRKITRLLVMLKRGKSDSYYVADGVAFFSVVNWS